MVDDDDDFDEREKMLEELGVLTSEEQQSSFIANLTINTDFYFCE